MLYTNVQDMEDVRVVQVLADMVQFNNYEDIFNRVRAQISDAANQVVLDLSRVTFMDSISIGMLVPVILYARRLGGDLKVAGLTPMIKNLFKMLRMDRVIEVYPDVPSAVASFAEGHTP
jgi:anti-sigma B factor antagonist